MLCYVPREFCLCSRLALLMYSLMTQNKAQGDLDLHQDNRLAHSERGLRCVRGGRDHCGCWAGV